MTNSTIVNNSATYGGGIMTVWVPTSAYEGVTLLNTTVMSNSADEGGGIHNYDTELSLKNSTVSNNFAHQFGGGIWNHGGMTLTHVTVSSNRGGGVWHENGVLNSTNAIIANSTNRPDYESGDGGLIGVNVGNLVEDGSFAAALAEDPLLGPIGDYGGATFAAPLLPGSPSIGAGYANGCLPTDQRGVVRPATGCDIGAFESQGFTLTAASGDNQKIAVNTPFPIPLAVTVDSHTWEANLSLWAVEPYTSTHLVRPRPGIMVNATATTTISGTQARLFVTANPMAGSYAVTATTTGGDAPVLFHLENLTSPFEAAAQMLLPAIGK
ncbi:MAG: hypothetical protein IPK16_27235 [Anaerolineales bacterium]|nr:hypothetical protein [Anaerolineales bacterium]